MKRVELSVYEQENLEQRVNQWCGSGADNRERISTFHFAKVLSEDYETEIARLTTALEAAERGLEGELDEHGLLPCPRCGRHYGLTADDYNNPTWWEAHCDCLLKLNLMVEIGDDTREGLIRKLNTRLPARKCLAEIAEIKGSKG